MSAYQFTTKASEDILDIWSFIAQDNPDAANRVEAAIFRACEFLARSPLAGSIRKDLTRLHLRFWVVHPYSNYLIVYDAEKDPLQIIRILHAVSNLPAILI